MKDKKTERRCPFFAVCAAYVVREKIEDNRRFEVLIKEKKVVESPKWSQRFCLTDFENCVHFQDRKRN